MSSLNSDNNPSKIQIKTDLIQVRKLGDTNKLAFPDLTSSLSAFVDQFDTTLSNEQLTELNKPLVGQILERTPLLDRERALDEWSRLVDRVKYVREIHDFFGINPNEPRKLTSPFTRGSVQFGPFDRVGIQLTWEAFVVETIGMALVKSGYQRIGSNFGSEQVQEMVRNSLIGRANKPYHVMLQKAAEASLNPKSDESSKLLNAIDLESLNPIGVHGGAKTELIWKYSGLDQIMLEKGQVSLTEICKPSAKLAEGMALLEGYRIIELKDQIIVTFEPWDNLARTLSHTANALVGTFSRDGIDGHGIFTPFDRQLVTYQAQLYDSHRIGIILSEENQIEWGIDKDKIPNGGVFLTDNITEVIWREGIVAIELCKKLAPQQFLHARHSALDADRAHNFLLNLIQWRIKGEGQFILGGNQLIPSDLELPF